MKYYFISLLALFFFSSRIYTQNKAVVSATKLNVLYRGIDNPISIAVPELACSELILEIDHEEISGEGCNYIVHPKKAGKVILKIKKKEGEDTLLIDEYTMRVKSIPMPTAYFAGFKGSNLLVEKNDILAAKGITARFDHLNFDLLIPIKSYDMILRKANDKIISLSSTTARLTEEMKEQIQLLQAGDQLAIANILALGLNDEVWDLGVIHLTIK